MAFVVASLFLSSIWHSTHASPLNQKDNIKSTSILETWTNICGDGCPTSWTREPICTNGEEPALESIISLMKNVPASASATFTPTPYCEEYMRPTDWLVEVHTTTETYTTTVGYDHWHKTTTTTTDLANPTATSYCPIPSEGVECGWDSNLLYTSKQGQAVITNLDPESCQQECLRRKDSPACKAYRVYELERGSGAWECRLFRNPIDQDWKDWRSGDYARGTQWFNRDCLDHAPKACKANAPTNNLPPTPIRSTTTPLITPGPTLIPRSPRPNPNLTAAEIAKRAAPVPDFIESKVPEGILSWLFWSACYCIATTASPVVTMKSSTTFVSFVVYPGTVTRTSESTVTYTETVRETTTWVSLG